MGLTILPVLGACQFRELSMPLADRPQTVAGNGRSREPGVWKGGGERRREMKGGEEEE